MVNDLEHILDKFNYEGKPKSIMQYGGGLINDTYLVETIDKDDKDYILQKINTVVFKEIDALSRNKVIVTKYIRSKFNPPFLNEFLQTSKGENYFQSSTGDCWQLSVYIPDAITYDIAKSSAIAFEAGKVIGKFHYMVSEFPLEKIGAGIPGFHDMIQSLSNYKTSIQNDLAKRIGKVKSEIKELSNLEELAMLVPELINKKQVPIRLVHYDTKLSNILFNKNDQALCLIDFDTMMQGTILYDYGDAIRSIANNGKEDDTVLDNIWLNEDYFKEFSRGFLIEAKSVLNTNELTNLVNGIISIIYEQTIRFLADYLNGDIYYKTEYSDHNLQRTRAQLKLLKEIVYKKDELEKIIKYL
jgi:thiamine kinase-like enzyme